MWILSVLGALAILFVPSAVHSAQTYQIDPAHSSIVFSVAHLMVSRTTGVFREFSGEIAFSPDDLAGSFVRVTVPVSGIDTRHEARDEHLRKTDFFDAEHFPEIIFVSREITSKEEGRYDVTGDMTLRGVTKEVVIPVQVLGPVLHPFGKGDVLGISAKFQVDRREYGLTWNRIMDNGGVLLGDIVDVEVNFELNSP